MSSRHNFHDGQIESFALGPRRELTIKIALDPVWNVQGPRSVAMRFGAIENFEEVAAFFEALPTPPAPDAYIAEIEGIVSGKEGEWCGRRSSLAWFHPDSRAAFFGRLKASMARSGG